MEPSVDSEISSDPLRQRSVQAATRGQLEEAILKLESEGWRRRGEPALATPFMAFKPPYWVQRLERGSAPPLPPPART